MFFSWKDSSGFCSRRCVRGEVIWRNVLPLPGITEQKQRGAKEHDRKTRRAGGRRRAALREGLKNAHRGGYGKRENSRRRVLRYQKVVNMPEGASQEVTVRRPRAVARAGPRRVRSSCKNGQAHPADRAAAFAGRRLTGVTPEAGLAEDALPALETRL